MGNYILSLKWIHYSFLREHQCTDKLHRNNMSGISHYCTDFKDKFPSGKQTFRKELLLMWLSHTRSS